MLKKFFIRVKNRLSYILLNIKTSYFVANFKKFGKNNVIWFPVAIYGKEHISIGDNCAINAFVHIWGHGGVEIGNNVMIAAHVSITSVTHDYNEPSMRFSPLICKKVLIEDDVWLGSGALILPGIKIGRGAVVGSGAVVTRDVPPFAIVVGNPARIIKNRYPVT